ncbi:MAG: SDR family NAD(P)-dependent oxidoreductase, partial [Anaerolineaceae bacterium]
LSTGSVFVGSGGTGGITAEVVRDLAKATRGTFYLLSRTVVDADDAELEAYRRDPAAYRTALQTRLLQSGQKVTPVLLEKQLAALERVSGTVQLVEDVEKLGGRALCIACDITDPQAVKTAAQTIAGRETQVDVFLHAAGLEISRKIESKPLDEVRQVIGVKLDGFRQLLRALEGAGRLPSRVAFFSSVAGRFGNAGQTDYSAANDALNKLAFWLETQYPGMQALSIDWGAWAQVGMASRGRIPDLMKMAGIEMMDPRSAAPMLRYWLEHGCSGEVLVSGSLGRLEELQDENDGMDVEKADQALRAGTPIHQMLSHLTAYNTRSGIRLDAELNPQELDYLRDHSINGVPVLPGVVGIEGFAVAARHISSVLGSAGSDFEVERLENIRFLAPFKFYGSKPRSLNWFAYPYRTEEGLTARVSLESDYERWNGQVDHTVHFTGIVHLAPQHSTADVTVEPPKWGRGKAVSAEEIYRLFFHGPAFQVLEAAQGSQEKVLGRLNKQVIHQQTGGPVLRAVPALIELCFQTAGLWEVGATGVMALPHSVGSLKVHNQHINGNRIYAEVVPHRSNGQLSFDARVVDAKGNLLLEMADYQTSPLPEPAESDAAEPMKALVGADELYTR